MVRDFPSTGFNITHSSVFAHQELRQVLAAYSEGVLKKNWRDYAISSDKDQTVFCVIERGQGRPAAVLYSISKTKSKKSNGTHFYRVFDGDRQIARTDSFMEALNIFRSAGKPGAKKLKVVK
jgi:hypothetical protein